MNGQQKIHRLIFQLLLGVFLIVGLASVAAGASVSVIATDSDAGEPGNNGEFTVTISPPVPVATLVNYSVTGVGAVNGSDYVALSNSVTVPVGGTVAIPLTVLDDSIVEGNESVMVTLASTDNPSVNISALFASDTVAISDDDSATVSIAATDGAADEAGDPGLFTVTLTNPASVDTIVNYSVAGTA
ncbi:MAG: Calx-beta domain-containing protein, partial [Desulforhopalus sp.]